MRRDLISSFNRLALQSQTAASAVASSSRLALPSSSPAVRACRSTSFLAPPRTATASSFRAFSAGSPRTYASAAPASSSFSIGKFSPGQAKKTNKRLGRGPSSGRGGTSGRGHKGQRARVGNGKPTPGFEGGQTPIMRRYPKRGFVNTTFEHKTVPLNIERLEAWIEEGKLNPFMPITAKELYYSRCVHSLGDGGIKLLGEGAATLRFPLNIVVSRASKSAIKAIEAAGGAITCKYYTPLTLRALIKPEKWTAKGKLVPNESVPVSRKDLCE